MKKPFCPLKKAVLIAGLLASSLACAVTYTYRVPSKGLVGSGGAAGGAGAPAGIPTIMDIATGNNSGIALDATGGLWTTGMYLGDGTTNQSATFKKVALAGRFIAVSAGTSHMLALKDDGTVWGAGAQSDTELGMGAYGSTFTSFSPIPGLTNVKSIVAGDVSSYVVKTDGTIWGVGSHSHCMACSTFTAIPIPAKQFASVSIRVQTLFATATDGSIWAFGANAYGQAGVGNANFVPSLTQVGAPGQYKMAKPGENFSAAIDSTGKLWVTGDNTNQFLGFASPSQVNSFTQTGAGATYTTVSLSTGGIMALTSTGELWASGSGGYGDFGDGLASTRTTFGKVGDGPFVKLITGVGGVTGNFVIKPDGTVWATGPNNNGQLGLDAVSWTPAFTQVLFTN